MRASSFRWRLAGLAGLIGAAGGASAALMIGCVPLPGGNLNSLGNAKSVNDKPSDDAAKRKIREVTPAEERVYLRNPEAGLVAYTAEEFDTVAKQAAAGARPLSAANVVCVRAPTKDWESADNAFDNSAAHRALSTWAALGKRAIGVRIDCTSRADLPGHLAKKLPLMENEKAQPPLFWDGDYLDHHSSLVTWLSRKLEQEAAGNLSIVVITGADWDGSADWKAADSGFNDNKHYKLVEDLVKLYHTAFYAADTSGRRKFPYAQLYISRRAVERCPSRTADLVKLLKANGVQLLDEGQGALPAWAGDFQRMLGDGYAAKLAAGDARAALTDIVSRERPRHVVLAAAAANSQKVCNAQGAALEQGAVGIGPRLRIVKAEYPKYSGNNRDIAMELTWANNGTMAPVDSWQLEVTFLTADNRPAGTVAPAFPEVLTTQWGPDFNRKFSLKLKAPPTTIGGIAIFNVAVALVHPQDPRRRLELALGDRTADGIYYRLGKIEVGN